MLSRYFSPAVVGHSGATTASPINLGADRLLDANFRGLLKVWGMFVNQAVKLVI